MEVLRNGGKAGCAILRMSITIMPEPGDMVTCGLGRTERLWLQFCSGQTQELNPGSLRIFVLIVFLLGLITKHYRDAHPQMVQHIDKKLHSRVHQLWPSPYASPNRAQKPSRNTKPLK
jgi:hypothetical protein